jgi:5'-nucleotidase
VLLIHEGGEPPGGPDECPGVNGPIVGIVEKLDRRWTLVVSGHTHQAYNCRIGGRLVTSAHRFGTLLTEIDLTLDRLSRDVVSASAHNLVIRHDRFTRDGAQTALIASYAERAAPLARRVVGTLSRPATAERNAAGESRLGRLVADAQLAATAAPGLGGAQIALTNPGGLRSPLLPGPGGEVRWHEVIRGQARRHRRAGWGADPGLRAGPGRRQLERRPGGGAGHGHPAARHGPRRMRGADGR